MNVPASALTSDQLEEVPRCALCGEGARTTRFEDPPFRVVGCDGCGLVYVTPRALPDVLPSVYGEDYWRSDSPKDRGYADYRADAPLYLRTFASRMQLVRRFAPRPGRALDVGCAAGFFLSVLRDDGWDVHGVELSPAIAAHARQLVGADRIHVGELASARFQPGSFDLVTLWDVVEHVPDPVALVRRAGSLLRPEGLLILETQNVASPFARLLGRRWQHYKHLEHLYHFSPATLDRLLSEAGLVRVHRTPRFGGKYVSMGFVRERAARIHPLLSRALRPFAPFDSASAYVNVFDELVVVARPGRAD